MRSMPAYLPETPSPDALRTRHLDNGHMGQNGAREEIPLISPESVAYTSKAAEHWRMSWRDRQYTEAGPAEGVSKGQASVSSPLLAMQNSFVRMRAIIIKQKQDKRKVSFGFWVTIFLMVCLTASLGAYIFYSYMPNVLNNAAHIPQNVSGQTPALSIQGATSTTFKIGQTLHIAGTHFGPHDIITFLLDTATPISGANGNPLHIQADAQGAFEVTIPIQSDWPTGDRSIQAVDAAAHTSSYLEIQIIPAAKPATSSPDLSITLNGQPISALTFTKQVGQADPAAQRITITNTSGAVLQWSASASAGNNLSWLVIEDNNDAGQLAISQPASIGIGVDTTGLGPKLVNDKNEPYTGQVLFTINNKEVLTLPVQLTITDAAPELVFSPSPIFATAKADGTCQAGATLTLINLGSVVVQWTAKPDASAQNTIQFDNSQGGESESGELMPSGNNGDTVVLTVRCSGVQKGQQFHISIYGNSTQASDTVDIL
jgi:hypothetical protein